MLDTMSFSILTLVVVAANVLGGAMAFPQAAKLLQSRRVDGVSPSWAAISATVNAWWSAYGLGVGDVGIVPVSVVSVMAYLAIAVALVIITLLAPPVTFAQSVSDAWYRVDVLWRDPFVKKVTGFSLAGVCAIGLLLSLRKRFPWFRWGAFAQWRAFHAVFGVTSLVALFAHTGFRFGHNLNYWLMLTFVLMNLLGGFAGVIAAMESRGIGAVAGHARQWRPVVTRLHLVLFWPFPVLLAFHVLSTLFY